MGHACKIWLALFTSIALVSKVLGQDFMTNCPAGCSCMWSSGNRKADCSGAHFKEIPKSLSSDIQMLNLTGNDLYEISRHAFDDVKLNNLKEVVLKDCKLRNIHKDGLSNLVIMTKLDLSKNSIKALHPDTFKEMSKITLIFLNDNRLEMLDDELFTNLPLLQKVYLYNNNIMQIGVMTFINVPKLKNLRLDGNKLKHLKIDTLNALTSLFTLDVRDNPWRCDCYLEPFMNWVMSKNLTTAPISCAEPAKVHGKQWNELNSSDFDCKPSIVYPASEIIVKSSHNNVTLSCQVNGHPLPEVKWRLGSQIINGSMVPKVKYDLTESVYNYSKWYNLTIIQASDNDNGEYVCVAKNSEGVEERRVNLSFIKSGMDNNMLPVLIGVSCIAAILLIIIKLLCWCCWRRRNNEQNKTNTSNREDPFEGSVIPEMEKSLKLAVNSVAKPSSSYDLPPLITSGGTEMSEPNNTLKDNDSVSAHNDDVSRSLELEHQPSKRSQYTLNVEYGRHGGRNYPSALLSFPLRDTQISPAASNTSTFPDTTTLPQHLYPISLINSPIYGMSTNPNIFKTLPHSRSLSHLPSPFTSAVYTPRQGYVTIPRRSRVPIQSSTASTQIRPSSEAQEIFYDNLGLRTTANGSSVLSLNKAGLEQLLSPMNNRPLPPLLHTPTVYQNPQLFYVPIEEQEPASSSIPQKVQNPRNSVSPQLSIQFSARSPGSLRRFPRTESRDENISAVSSTIKANNRHNESNITMKHSTGTLGISGKLPPRPPLKPKKKPNRATTQKETIFEDEGEDGTEV